MTEIKAAGSTVSRGLLRRGPNAFILASAVSGFAWYFAQQQISDFNSRQSELIRRVEKDETVQDCTTFYIQSSRTLTTVTLTVGTAKRSTLMEWLAQVDSWSSAVEESRKATSSWHLSSSTPATSALTSMKTHISSEITIVNSSSTLVGYPRAGKLQSLPPLVPKPSEKKSILTGYKP